MTFKAGVDSRGVIQYLNYNIYEDNGYKTNETFTILGKGIYNNAYKKERWNYKSFDSLTDTAKNTWARAPGKILSLLRFQAFYCLTCFLYLT